MYPGLTESDVQELAERFSIFVPLNGRISISGVNSKNLEILVDALIHIYKK